MCAAPSNDLSRHRIPPQSTSDTPGRAINIKWGLGMACEPTDTAIEKIIASCDGNMRGALEALLRVNEFLEAELQQLYATISSASADVETVH